MTVEEIIDLALTSSYYDKSEEKVMNRIIGYVYDPMKRKIKIREKITSDKIIILRRLLNKSGNGDINIIVGEPNL